MTITATQVANEPPVQHASGAYLDDASTPAAATITLGFRPYYFHWLNATDRIGYEWYNGMAAGTTHKSVAAGTRTLDTGDAAITVNTSSVTVVHTALTQTVGGATVTIAAAAILQNKQNYWRAIG